jgi:UPF0755 protein
VSKRPRAPKKKRQGLSFLRRLAITAVSALVTLAVIAALVAGWAVWSFQGAGPKARNGDVTVVILRDGAGLNEIAGVLERDGVVRSGPFFAAAAQITGAARSMKAGEYEFPSHASMAFVLEKIRKGQVVRHSVTIPEGVTADMVREILMAQPVLEGSIAAPPEGSVLPDTYDVRRGEDRAVVLQRMMDARDKLLSRLWEQRQPGLPFDTPEEAVILASIVEKETSVPEERPKTARVFVNRLAKGMRLETDPTIIYGLTRGRPLGRGIRKSERDTPTPYNTYHINGLPPTPIANPGRESLAAVLDPPPGDWLFFVANGTGGHTFTNSFDEHLKEVAKLRQLEKLAPPLTGQEQAPAAATPAQGAP